MQAAKKSSASSFAGLALPKGTSRKTLKGRKERAEAAVVQEVRPQCVVRDGYCRASEAARKLPDTFEPCDGPSEWSHYNRTHRRSKTRGMPPEERHQRKHSMMLCRTHSHAYDQNRMDIEEKTELGCDGPLRMERDGVVWEETE